MLGVSVSAAETTVYIEPPDGSASIGSTFTMNVRVKNVSDLYGYQFDVSYDPSILQAESVKEGSLLKGIGSTWFNTGKINNSTGLINDIYNVLMSVPEGASGNGTLASITFKKISDKDSQTELINAILSDSGARPISAKGTDNLTAGPASLTSSGGQGGGDGGINNTAWANIGSNSSSTIGTSSEQLVQVPNLPPEEALENTLLGGIRGRIVNQGGQLVPGATAAINGIVMETDTDGVFAFTLIHPGTYEVQYNAEGYVSESQVLEVIENVITAAPTAILKQEPDTDSVHIVEKDSKKAQTDVERTSEDKKSAKNAQIKDEKGSTQSKGLWWRFWRWLGKKFLWAVSLVVQGLT